MTKIEALERYKKHLEENATYMGVGQLVLDLINSNKVAEFLTSNLVQESYELAEENKNIQMQLKLSRAALKYYTAEGNCNCGKDAATDKNYLCVAHEALKAMDEV